MNKYFNKFKKAFSLLELSISILIVSIIVVVCVPLIMDQMKKTEEYAYFLGYKTVEKLGTQIVAHGDPADGQSATMPVISLNGNNKFGNKFTDKLDKFSKIFTPKAQAVRTVLLSFPSYEYDMARICNGNQNVKKDYMDISGQDFTEEDIASFDCNGANRNLYKDADRLKLRFGCRGGSLDIKAHLATTEETAEEFCNRVATECLSLYSEYGATYEYFIITLNQAGNRSQYGQCMVYIPETVLSPFGASGAAITEGSMPSFNATNLFSCSNDNGYENMGGDIRSGCSCNGTNPVRAINNTNICCPTVTAGNVAYVDVDGNCVEGGCKIGAFNEKTGSCCPNNSFYSRSIGHCACAQGYEPDDAANPTVCSLITPPDCPTGYHLEGNAPAEGDPDTRICVINPPITKASRFCELISDNYNVSNANCGTFNNMVEYGDGVDAVSYNRALFEAITAGGTQYLSAKAVAGAFNGVAPNIIFSNGLKLWILGDKVASIAGLSFNPTDYTPDINACVDRKVYTKADCDNAGDNNYFCKTGNHCFTINNGNGSGKLQDARNCCPAVDFDDLRAGNYAYLRDPRAYAINGFTVFVDITGDKDSDQGGGTLWKDVFPFYISANGTVYPGYPLNALKTDISLYQGGNSSALSSDVYYFDIIDGRRKKQIVYTSIPYSRAQCFAMQVSPYTPYCQNLGTKFRGIQNYNRMDQFIYSDDNPCSKHRCYIHVKNKIKFL